MGTSDTVKIVERLAGPVGPKLATRGQIHSESFEVRWPIQVNPVRHNPHSSKPFGFLPCSFGHGEISPLPEPSMLRFLSCGHYRRLLDCRQYLFQEKIQVVIRRLHLKVKRGAMKRIQRSRDTPQKLFQSDVKWFRRGGQVQRIRGLSRPRFTEKKSAHPGPNGVGGCPV